MLQIHLKNGTSVQLCDGQPSDVDWLDVRWVEASGAELNLILSDGYPHHRRDTQIYIGDTARQIVANWRSED